MINNESKNNDENTNESTTNDPLDQPKVPNKNELRLDLAKTDLDLSLDDIKNDLNLIDESLLDLYKNKPCINITTPLSSGTLVEVVNENEPLNSSLYITTQTNKQSLTTPTSPQPLTPNTANLNNTRLNNLPPSRYRNDSLKIFTDKVKSFSNDLLRTIESAHELVDLKNSNFSAATQTAAAQQYHQNNQVDSYLTRHAGSSFKSRKQVNNEDFLRKPRASTEIGGLANFTLNEPSLLSTSLEIAQPKSSHFINDVALNLNESNLVAETSKSSHDINEEDYVKTNSLSKTKAKSVRNETEINKSADLNKFFNKKRRTLDEINALNNNFNKSEAEFDTEVVESFLDELNLNDLSMQNKLNEVNERSNLAKTVDQNDFRVRKRYIFKNGSKKAIPDDIHISILEVFIYLWGVTTFFADLISDIILSIEYFHSSRTWLGAMTLLFVIVPNVTLSLFSLSWYIDKYYSDKQLKKDQQHEQSKISSTCDSITFWITTIFFVVFQLDLVWKYIQGFVYTLKGWACRSLFHNLKWEKYYIEKQIKCDTDIGMLRLIDVFMDSGPQVLLQLYVITTQNLNKLGIGNLIVFTFKDFQTTSTEIKQFVSIVSSLFSMGYALAGYHRCLRNQQFIFCLETNKPLPRPMSWLSTIMQFLWYLFLIAPRVLAMAIFASAFRSWFFMIIFTHWLIMYFWILRLKTNYCISSQEVYSAREEIFEKFYDFVCSFIYIFVYFNLKAGPTRLRYLIYYILFYSENVLFCVCYFLFTKETNYTYKLIMMLIVIFGFWIAITFQIVYYLHCHPSHDITICVRKKTKFHFIHKETLKPTELSISVMSKSENEMHMLNHHHHNHHHAKNNEKNEVVSSESELSNPDKNYRKSSRFSFRNRFSKKSKISEEKEQETDFLKAKEQNTNSSSSANSSPVLCLFEQPVLVETANLSLNEAVTLTNDIELKRNITNDMSTPLKDKLDKIVVSPKSISSVSSFLSFSSYSSNDLSKYNRSKIKKKSHNLSLIAFDSNLSKSDKSKSLNNFSKKRSYDLDMNLEAISPPIAKMNEFVNEDLENSENKIKYNK